MNVLLTGALALLMAACGSGPGSDSALGDRSVQLPGDTALVQTADPELREMAAKLLPDLARRSGLELRAPVRIARRSRKQLVDYLTTKLDRDLPAERARGISESYTLLGLLPEGFDLRSMLLTVYTEQVAGFYDPDSTALFVMEDQPAGSVETVLIHELVHAVQDQATDLDSLTAPERGNDRQIAAQAAIEGHATVVMFEYLAEQATGAPVDLSTIPDFTSQVRPALESLRLQYPALAGAPRIIQEELLFPYLEGAGYVQSLWQARAGRPAPFGSLLPESSEQVLDGVGGRGSEPDRPTVVELTGLGGASSDYENGLGEMETGVLLEELTGDPVSAGELGWDGDRYALFHGTDGSPSLVWFSVWDTVEDRDAVQRRIEANLRRLPRPARLEREVVQGRPGLLLTVGEAPEVRVRLAADPAES